MMLTSKQYAGDDSKITHKKYTVFHGKPLRLQYNATFVLNISMVSIKITIQKLILLFFYSIIF